MPRGLIYSGFITSAMYLGSTTPLQISNECPPEEKSLKKKKYKKKQIDFRTLGMTVELHINRDI